MEHPIVERQPVDRPPIDRPLRSQMLRAAPVAKWLNTTEKRVYHWARVGLLPCVRIGRNVRFNEDEIRAWIEAGGTAQISGDA